MKTGFRSKSIWLYIIGGLFIIFTLGSIYGKSSEATTTTDKEVKSSSVNNAEPVKTENQSIATNTTKEVYLVSRVVDGDTIELENDEKVRYIGIDTPETVDPRKPVQCFGKEASNKNKELVEGKKVILEKDISDRDKYSRLLRYVYLEDGTFINLELVKLGYARNYTYPPDIKHQEELKQAEQEARNNKLGLWADNACSQESTQSTSQTTNQSNNTTTEQPLTQQSIAPTQSNSQSVVKKSVNNICHAPNTTYYDRTKNFTPYNSVEECLASGGRLPLR